VHYIIVRIEQDKALLQILLDVVKKVTSVATDYVYILKQKLKPNALAELTELFTVQTRRNKQLE